LKIHNCLRMHGQQNIKFYVLFLSHAQRYGECMGPQTCLRTVKLCNIVARPSIVKSSNFPIHFYSLCLRGHARIMLTAMYVQRCEIWCEPKVKIWWRTLRCEETNLPSSLDHIILRFMKPINMQVKLIEFHCDSVLKRSFNYAGCRVFCTNQSPHPCPQCLLTHTWTNAFNHETKKKQKMTTWCKIVNLISIR
jgi:hypothetical protein